MLRPAGEASEPLYVIVNVASTCPFKGGKNTCTDRLACTSVKASGSLGLSATVPKAVDANVPAAWSIRRVLLTTFPDAGRSGLL